MTNRSVCLAIESRPSTRDGGNYARLQEITVAIVTAPGLRSNKRDRACFSEPAVSFSSDEYSLIDDR